METPKTSNYPRTGPLNIFRKSKHSIEEVLKHVEINSTKKDLAIIDGDPIKLGSDRYKTFKFKGLKCVKCELQGAYFAKERSAGTTVTWHMNLYALDKNGEEVLMTKDHIFPKSLGGKDVLENYQPMCSICNTEKGSKVEPAYIEHDQKI
jgi:hypothetical protein